MDNIFQALLKFNNLYSLSINLADNNMNHINGIQVIGDYI